MANSFSLSFQVPIWKEPYRKENSLSDDISLYNWLMILECLLNIYRLNDRGKDSFALKIAESLKLSGINAVLCTTADGYLFYPTNAELLDHKIVIDVLNWLSDYPPAKEQYNQALRMVLKGDRSRHTVDDIRLSFELFLKQYFNKKKLLLKINVAKLASTLKTIMCQ